MAFGHIIGGLLAGVGKGIEVDYLARRDAALEALRAERQTAAIADEYRFKEKAAVAERKGRLEDAITLKGVDAQFEADKLAKGAEYTERRDAKQHQYSKEEIAAKAAADARLAQMRGNIDRLNARDKALFEDGLEKNDIKDVVPTAAGATVLRNDGSTFNLDFDPRAPAENGFMLPPRAGTPAQAEKPARAPAERGPNGPSAPATRPSAPPAGKTYTKTDLDEAVAAEATKPQYKDMPRGEVRVRVMKRLHDLGYKMTAG